ncbi:MAG: hypothetical protein ACYC26_10110 [Phycisphaerales bacterium]
MAIEIGKFSAIIPEPAQSEILSQIQSTRPDTQQAGYQRLRSMYDEAVAANTTAQRQQNTRP